MAPGQPTVEWVTDFARFAELREGWDRLAEHEASPFASHGWFSAWWQAFGGRDRPRVCVVRELDELTAAFPLCASPRRLEAMANSHTPVFRPLSRDEVAMSLLLDAVLDAAAELAVPALRASGHEVGVLLDGSRARGRLQLIEHHQRQPVVDLTGGLDRWEQSARPKLRSLRPRARRLRSEHEAHFVLVEPPSNLNLQLQDGLALEASGWKGAAGTAISSSPDTLRFYRRLAEVAHGYGQLRFSELRVDGRLIAFSFALLRRRRLYQLKFAYDEDYRRLAPGLLLQQAVIERCFDLDLEAYELLGDDADWKRRFATTHEDRVRLFSYRARPVPAARYGYRRAVRPALRRAHRRLRLAQDRLTA